MTHAFEKPGATFNRWARNDCIWRAGLGSPQANSMNSSEAHRTLPNASSGPTGQFSANIGSVPEGLLRDVMTTALPIRSANAMNGEGEGEGEGERELMEKEGVRGVGRERSWLCGFA